MWLKQLKIAVVERNIDKINELMDDIPQLEKKEEIESAIYLLKEATNLVQGLKDKTKKSMIQMKKNIAFLRATEAPKTSKLDIRLLIM